MGRLFYLVAALLRCVLGVLRGEFILGRFPRRNAEYAEVAQRKTVFPTDSLEVC